MILSKRRVAIYRLGLISMEGNVSGESVDSIISDKRLSKHKLRRIAQYERKTDLMRAYNFLTSFTLRLIFFSSTNLCGAYAHVSSLGSLFRCFHFEYYCAVTTSTTSLCQTFSFCWWNTQVEGTWKCWKFVTLSNYFHLLKNEFLSFYVEKKILILAHRSGQLRSNDCGYCAAKCDYSLAFLSIANPSMWMWFICFLVFDRFTVTNLLRITCSLISLVFQLIV